MIYREAYLVEPRCARASRLTIYILQHYVPHQGEDSVDKHNQGFGVSCIFELIEILNVLE